MRERILDYLREIGRAAPASEILQRALGIQSPNGAMAEKLLRGGIFAGRRSVRLGHPPSGP